MAMTRQALPTLDRTKYAPASGLAKGGLYLIDARVSPTTASDPYAKVHHGIPNQAPMLRSAA